MRKNRKAAESTTVQCNIHTHTYTHTHAQSYRTYILIKTQRFTAEL